MVLILELSQVSSIMAGDDPVEVEPRHRIHRPHHSHVSDAEDFQPLDLESDDSSAKTGGPRPVAHALACVLLWYAFSISLSVYNKWMFSDRLKLPILSTSLHQLVQTVLALLAVQILGLKPHNLVDTSSPIEFAHKVGPAVLASAADIGLGNTSLILVTLSFYTMVKTSALGFVLLFAVLFRLEQPSWGLAAIIGILTMGVVMMVAGEAHFSFGGFLLVMGAACASGLRWALIKLLLGGTSAPAGAKKHHPIQTILAISPGMFIALTIFGLIVEGPSKFIHADLWTDVAIPVGVIMLLLPGVLAFCMTWSEFELLNVTGPLTLAIAGICKEVATILISVAFLGDRLSLINSVGLIVTLVSIGAYHWYRLQ